MARAQCTLDAVEAPLAGAHGVVSIALTSGAGKRGVAWPSVRSRLNDGSPRGVRSDAD